VIFYTLQGPKYKIEIHDDKIKLIRKGIWGWLSPKSKETIIQLSELSIFQASSPSLIGYGKLECSTFNGKKIVLRFSTNSQMMSKIERYMQKIILKNYNTKALEFGKDESSPVLAAA